MRGVGRDLAVACPSIVCYKKYNLSQCAGRGGVGGETGNVGLYDGQSPLKERHVPHHFVKKISMVGCHKVTSTGGKNRETKQGSFKALFL